MAHSYWRLYFPEGVPAGPGYQTAKGVCLVGVEMRESKGGANAATGGTASASSEYDTIVTKYLAVDAFQPYAGTGSRSRWQTYSSDAPPTTNFPAWLRYQFAAPVDIEEVTMTGVAGTGGAAMPRRFSLQYSDDGTNWTTKYSWHVDTPWVTDGSDSRAFNDDNAAPPPTLFVTQGRVVSFINYPAEQVQATALQVQSAFRQYSQQLRVTQLRVISIVRGRTYNPKLRAWAFTLDAHEFYVLRLGDERTYLFDLYSGQWYWWTSGEEDFWRPQVGGNWATPGGLADEYGSNIVCGDDTYGHLWILDPEYGVDDDPKDPEQTLRFPRVATGQLVTRERNYEPIYKVFLTGSFGQPVEDGDTIEHLFSDDLGNTFISAGALPVVAGNYNQEFCWSSLGMAIPSGRLFRIVDDGAFTRIDGLDVSFGDDNG